jgi:hypothetical protein
MNNFKKLISVCFFLMAINTSCDKPKTDRYENSSWIKEIRDDHPRLFFNKNSFNAIKEKALNDEREIFDQMKNRVDKLIGIKIEFPDPLVQDGSTNSNHLYGTRAAEAAFVYLILENEKYLDLCKKILRNLVEYYTLRNEHNLNIHWYAYSRINALAAYDWIYNYLTEDERIEIGEPLLGAIYYMSLKERGSDFRRNSGDYKTGFYGPPCLPWYAGLVFYQTGIDDSLSISLLRKGYNDHNELLKYRRDIAGEAGGASSAALNYSMGAYPHAEFNFFHTFNSATGLDISKEWSYVPYFLHYVLWNWLPGEKIYGYGDVDHITNDLPLGSMHLHLSQMIHFFGETHSELISLAKWMRQKTQKKMEEVIPYSRFLLIHTYDNIKPQSPPDDMRIARHFDNMGQIFMRSGSSSDDTYALFTAGGILTQHRHYDNNNFVIFKKGFLAMDTGTRPEPGLHLPYYFCRTVAHNCITIKMPGEIMPNYWGGPSLNEEPAPPVPNDGGQNSYISEILAFDEKEEYAYIASDATESYHNDKADLVLRQFIFLPPDHFVIFDRVNSSKAEYKKRWLLHTAKEPQIKTDEFYTEHWGGRLFCRTLFPKNAVLTKIGGHGKQFWSDGRNWPLPLLTPEDWRYERRHLNPPDTLNMLGQWRIEVTPDKLSADDIFLHLIQVGDTSLKSMVDSEPIECDDMVGVRFVLKDKKYEVMFITKNEVGGIISISKDGQKIIEEYFSDQVKVQQGLF